MDDQLKLEIYDVLTASKAFQHFDSIALHDFAANVKLILLSASENIDPKYYNITERLFVVFKGHLKFTIKGDNVTDDVIYELISGDVIAPVTPIGNFQNTPRLLTSCETTLIGISWATIDHHLQNFPLARKTLEETIWRSTRRTQLAIHLYQLFGVINSSVLTDFESMIEWQLLTPGSVLFHQNDPADAVFFVLSGHLRVALEEQGKPDREINEIKAGETIGEVAFLTEAPRSATVYALRDTVLARLSYPCFNKLMDKHPLAMKQIARLVSKRLQRHSVRIDSAFQTAMIFGVVSSHPDCPLSEASSHLVKALSTLGTTLHLNANVVDKEFGRHAMSQISNEDPASLRLAQWLHQQEANYQFVVYEADRTWSPWTQRAIQHAEQVVIFAISDADPTPVEVEKKMDALWLRGRTPQLSLVLIHTTSDSEPHDTFRWLTPRSIGGHFHVRIHSHDDFARLARILSGRGVALVLGGGGARGYAHIGLVRAMEEIGIPIDIVGGTSMGAILAGLVAMQYDSRKMHAACKKYISGFFDYTLPMVSLIKGKKVRTSLNSVFGERQIEDLWLPYFCVATNLTQADQVVHRHGFIAEAIRSSMSLPGILAPCYYGGDLLVDGGVVNNLPFDVMRNVFKGNKVIAADVEPKQDLSINTGFTPEISGWAVALKRLNPFRKSVEIPSILSVLIRSATLASVYATNRLIEQNPPDLYLHLPVEEWGVLAFDDIDDIVTRGYEASLSRLQTWLHN